jgi:hypothetical protein
MSDVFATECSAHQGHDRGDGGTITGTLSAADRAPKASHTPRQTGMLAGTPPATAVPIPTRAELDAAYPDGAYTYAISGGTGNGRYGGWVLVVVYRDPGGTARNLTVFDGAAVVNSSAANVTINIDGSQAPPTGAVNARVWFVG